MQRKHIKQQPVVAEVLEERAMLSAISLNNGVLTVNGNKADNVIVVSNDQNGDVVVKLDEKLSTFSSASVTSLVVVGRKGNDVLRNETNLDAVIVGGKGNDVIRGGGGNDVMIGGQGNDIINDFGGMKNVLDGGKGNDTLQTVAPGSDVLLGGQGNDSLYAIVGGPNVALGQGGRDEFIVRQGVETIDATKNERVVAFAGRAPGTLDNGVLYVGLGTGGTTVVNQVGNKIILNSNGQVFTFNVKDVDVVAGVGSPNDDIFINNTDIDSVYYGSAGNDILVGGSGDDLLKGGSGNDLLVGNSGNDDLAGDPGIDTILGNRGKDKLRVDLLDLVFADLQDLVIFQ